MASVIGLTTILSTSKCLQSKMSKDLQKLQLVLVNDRWDRCKLGIKAHKCFLTESARQTRNEAKPNIVTESVPGSEHTPGILV